MTCKEMRAQQLEELKDGIFPGTFFVTITHFDGKLIAQYAFDTRKECEECFERMREVYKYRAHVKKTVVFDI